ncbi:hypothetical protein AA103196_0609 [Ameyamaea chiangmaiensis NBRC 103196]|uniref:TVP38/TMEM64 family membrane protein n=1 Tax=Ameyamaea chiangmaiensis TaxID=442969 RepID=A0A850PAX0_9PROT|nr:VTT domain-containing protein [Ameyamaea chiangmaiensis]MBS4076380.1 TVP38/TMEM64 family protein [Ameyamaea chiangmaiensis]NVN41695.1 TVP38/TMEM64 family protein [Ameyamaea chiangmaiensis]GBQ63505.1 hypothetical protein AA103196_0609 [Ameyamaea chiangmaiensis NBRC 103196]
MTASASGPQGRGALARWRQPIGLLAGLALLVLLLQRMPALQHLLADPHTLRGGWRGALVLLAMGCAYCAFGLPRQILCLAAGAVFGPWLGLALATTATMVGALAAFGWARWVARDWARRRFGGAMARLDGLLASGPFLAILSLRLLPVGSSLLVNCGAGLSGIGVAPFAVGTLLGSTPQGAVFVVLGTGVRLGQEWRIALAAVLFALSALLGVLLMRRARRIKNLL